MEDPDYIPRRTHRVAVITREGASNALYDPEVSSWGSFTDLSLVAEGFFKIGSSKVLISPARESTLAPAESRRHRNPDTNTTTAVVPSN